MVNWSCQVHIILSGMPHDVMIWNIKKCRTQELLFINPLRTPCNITLSAETYTANAMLYYTLTKYWSIFPFLRSLIVILRRMMPYPITWTRSSSRKSPPVVSWLKRPHPPYRYPAQTAPPMRPPTLTAIAASCLRWDQSGISINCGARMLFSHSLFALLWSLLLLFSCLSNSPYHPMVSVFCC